MIFPNNLPAITMYLDGTGLYYELPVNASKTEVSAEFYYNREAISAKKDVKMSGLRIDIEASISQAISHEEIRAFFGDLYSEPSGKARLYLKAKDGIDNTDNYFDVLVTDLVANTSYRNTINRQSYDFKFTGVTRDASIITGFVITNDGFYYLTNEGDRYVFTFDLN